MVCPSGALSRAAALLHAPQRCTCGRGNEACRYPFLCTVLVHDVQVVNIVSGYGLPWQSSFAIIVLLYFYSHYLFASGAAHIGAMYTAFLSVAIACGTPGLLAAVALGQVRTLALDTRMHLHAARCEGQCKAQGVHKHTAAAHPAFWLLLAWDLGQAGPLAVNCNALAVRHAV